MKLVDFIPSFLKDLPPSVVVIGSTLIFLGMGTMALIVRQKAAKRPITAKKIILPPLFMATGFWMFIFEEFRVPWMQVLEAFSVGVLFSLFLTKTTHFKKRGGEIYVQPSKAFIFILVGLLIVRVIAKMVLSSSIDVGELGGMFFILAFGMIVSWRIGMYIKYQQLVKGQ